MEDEGNLQRQHALTFGFTIERLVEVVRQNVENLKSIKMRNLIASHFFWFSSVTTFCLLGLNTFSDPVRANPILDLQEEVLRRGIPPQNIDSAMRYRGNFPDSNFPYYERVNGCSSPGWTFTIAPPSNRWFESACNNHDRCYATPGQSKSICDAEMLRETLDICESIINKECSITADIYYWALVSFQTAQEAYREAQGQQTAYIAAIYGWLDDGSRIICTNSNLVTDIPVNPRDRIIIRASGTIVFGAFAGGGNPWGIDGFRSYNYFSDVRHGILMARIRLPGMRGLDGFFPIGEGWNGGREATLSEPGVLEFLVNDNNPQDNRGEFCVEVTNLGSST